MARAAALSGPCQALKDRHEGGAEALRLLPDLREAVGQAVHDLPAQINGTLHQLVAGTAQRLIELIHDAEGEGLHLLLLVGRSGRRRWCLPPTCRCSASPDS